MKKTRERREKRERESHKSMRLPHRARVLDAVGFRRRGGTAGGSGRPLAPRADEASLCRSAAWSRGTVVVPVLAWLAYMLLLRLNLDCWGLARSAGGFMDLEPVCLCRCVCVCVCVV